ncbi:MAG: MBL fold metallo-hydrolase [Chloroflexi bacterium]|nr:MBL fold metallo-hydrolase [Chloroflexota bacterium]
MSHAGERISAPGDPVEVRLVRLRWSNVYLLLGERPIVVDAGSPGDETAILAGLAAAGRRPRDLAAIVLTHGRSATATRPWQPRGATCRSSPPGRRHASWRRSFPRHSPPWCPTWS